MKKLLKILPIVLLIIYLLLLIPEPAIDDFVATDTGSFVWNQDEYWSYLESMFQIAMKMDSASLTNSIEIGFKETKSILDSCTVQSLEPSSPLLTRLETSFFELSPLVAAETYYLPQLISLHNRLRLIIKEKSYDWDMNSQETRDRLYRLLYGTRVAVEEIILQTENNLVPALALATNEPSATPSAQILGVTVHSGDILVSRGGAPTSALIARGNDYPGNFSHVALLHVDESSGKISMVESHIRNRRGYRLRRKIFERYKTADFGSSFEIRPSGDHRRPYASP